MQQLDLESYLRDQAMDRFEEHRAELLDIAREYAVAIFKAQGDVTSPEVIEAMRANGYAERLKEVDNRFMGAVFRKGWRRVGLKNNGSHKSASSVWVLEDKS